MNIHDVLEHLQTSFGCFILTEVEKAPADIDIYCPPERLQNVASFLGSVLFTCTWCTDRQHVYRRYEDAQLYILDLIADFSIYAGATPSLQLSDAGNLVLGHSAELHRAYKRLCSGNPAKFAAARDLWPVLCTFMSHADYFSRQRIPFRDLDGLAPEAAFRRIHKSLRGRVQRGLYLIRNYAAMLGTGYSMAFIGPDGSGKSFITSLLLPIGRTRTLYMGDWFFGLQSLYDRLMKLPTPYNRIIYVFYLIENALRRLRVSWLCFIGYIVLIDRFPGTNRNIMQSGLLARINRLTFKIFPKPDMIVLLLARPEIVYQRKQELTPEQIKLYQDKLTEQIADTAHMSVDTEQLDATLNQLLATIFARINPHA